MKRIMKIENDMNGEIDIEIQINERIQTNSFLLTENGAFESLVNLKTNINPNNEF